MNPKDRLQLAVTIADLDLAICDLEQQLAPHLQRLDDLRRERLQALQVYAQPPEPDPEPDADAEGALPPAE